MYKCEWQIVNAEKIYDSYSPCPESTSRTLMGYKPTVLRSSFCITINSLVIMMKKLYPRTAGLNSTKIVQVDRVNLQIKCLIDFQKVVLFSKTQFLQGTRARVHDIFVKSDPTRIRYLIHDFDYPLVQSDSCYVIVFLK